MLSSLIRLEPEEVHSPAVTSKNPKFNYVVLPDIYTTQLQFPKEATHFEASMKHLQWLSQHPAACLIHS